MNKAVSYILAGITMFSFLCGGIYAWSKVENKVESTAQAVIKIGQRLDQKIETDTYNTLRERLWIMEKEYGPIDKVKDLLIKKEMKEIKDEIELQKEKLKKEIP